MPSLKTFPYPKKRKHYMSCLPPRKLHRAVRIGQEARAPGEGNWATSKGPLGSQSLGFSANKITRKKD